MKQMKILVMVLTVILFFGGCTKNDEFSKNDNFVTLEQAIEIAKTNVENTITNKNQTFLRSEKFTTLNVISFDDEFGITALYIVNYRIENEDYFNIISADSRLEYLLAFGGGVIEPNDIVEGLSVWMNEQIKVIQQIRLQNLTKKEVLTEVIQAKVLPENDRDCCEACPNWPECEIKPWIGCGDPNAECDPCDAVNNLTIIGPLMSSEWGQGCFTMMIWEQVALITACMN